MTKPAMDNRVFLAFAAAAWLGTAGGLVLGNAISPDQCRSFGAGNPTFGMATGIYSVFIARAWPCAASSRRLESLAARAGVLLLLVLAAASLQPVLYCAVKSGLGSGAALGAVVALWFAVLLFAHLAVARHAERLLENSAAQDEEPRA